MSHLTAHQEGITSTPLGRPSQRRGSRTTATPPGATRTEPPANASPAAEGQRVYVS